MLNLKEALENLQTEEGKEIAISYAVEKKLTNEKAHLEVAKSYFEKYNMHYHAARLCEQTEDWERAISNYIKATLYEKAAEIHDARGGLYTSKKSKGARKQREHKFEVTNKKDKRRCPL